MEEIRGEENKEKKNQIKENGGDDMWHVEESGGNFPHFDQSG